MTTPLTPRQLDVLRLSMAGYTNAEIAERLFIQPQTAKNYRWTLRRKGISLPHRRLPLPDPDTAEHLSPREAEACRLARAGLTDREIASRMGVTPSGAATFLRRARLKAECREAAP